MQFSEMAESEVKYSGTGQIQIEKETKGLNVGIVLSYQHLYVKINPMGPTIGSR